MPLLRVFLAVTVLTACTTRLGTAPLVARDAELVGTKLLRPGATGRSCRTTVLGVPLGGGAGTIDDAMARLLALDSEGDLVSNAVVEEERIVTGVVNRRCIVLRGDLGRSITTVVIPAPAGHHGHAH